MLIASRGCRNPTAACARLFQPSPDPQVLAEGGEVICHGGCHPLSGAIELRLVVEAAASQNVMMVVMMVRA